MELIFYFYLFEKETPKVSTYFQFFNSYIIDPKLYTKFGLALRNRIS